MEVFISKALLDTNIIHDDFILVHNELKEYHEMQGIKRIKRSSWKIFRLFMKQCCRIA